MKTVCNDPWLASREYNFNVIVQYTDMNDTVFKNGRMYFLKTRYDEKKLDHFIYHAVFIVQFQKPEHPTVQCPRGSTVHLEKPRQGSATPGSAQGWGSRVDRVQHGGQLW